MELEFDTTKVSCLQQVKQETKSQELTQEVRLTEQQPDIGSVLGAWGQCLIRGKQWHSGSMEISGGIMAFVLYSPEDGSPCRNVQTWLPFSFRWELPQTGRDGIMEIRCSLNAMDARSASARKLMVRGEVQATARALVLEEATLTEIREPPEDLQILTDRIPVEIPVEAGEKAFSVEDVLPFSSGSPQPEHMVSYRIQPEITDRKVMGDKVVFRGTALLHILYASEDGLTYSQDFDVPFSQYAQLDQDHDPEADCRVVPLVTALEVERNDQDQWQVKAGLACQYTIYDSRELCLIRDLYSNIRDVRREEGVIRIPIVTGMEDRIDHVEIQDDVQGNRPIDTTVYLSQQRNEDGKRYLSGTTQILYTDLEGMLQCRELPWSREIPNDQEMENGNAVLRGKTRTTVSPSGSSVQFDVAVERMDWEYRELKQVTGAELSEPGTPDPDRPSVILRRAGKESLWELAKMCGSTEQAIREANGLEMQPQPQQVLLIPVE